ncbi:MAG: flavin reductase family protein [bacterium]|nr:flavin reductase family protein [Candidatus Kapabacteria bacterium]
MHRNDYRKRGAVTSVHPDEMRRALRRFASGVTIVTAELDGEQLGITVSAFASISLMPPIVMVSINNESPLRDAVITSEHFAVHILSDAQRSLAERFSQPVPSSEKYREVAFILGPSGAPMLSDTLASIDCVLEQTIAIGSHMVMFGRVVYAEAAGKEVEPLIYYNRGYRSLGDPTEGSSS